MLRQIDLAVRALLAGEIIIKPMEFFWNGKPMIKGRKKRSCLKNRTRSNRARFSRKAR